VLSSESAPQDIEPPTGTGSTPADSSSDALVTVPVTVCGVTIGAGSTECSVAEPVSDNALVDVPVTVCGIGAGVLGDAGASCAPASGTGGGGTVDVPVTVCGIGIGVLGDSSTTCGPTGPSEPTNPTDPTDPTDPVDPTSPVNPGSSSQTIVSPAGFAPSALRPAAIGVINPVVLGAPFTASATAQPQQTAAAVGPESTRLAFTGLPVAAGLGLAVLLLLAGLGLLFGTRRRVVRS
jgi:hypothetical protein